MDRPEYGKAPPRKGETDSGGRFAPLSSQACKTVKIFNAQMSKYAGDMAFVTALLTRSVHYVQTNPNEINETDLIDICHLIHLANIGRQHMLFQLKETADILKEAGLIKEGDDPWNPGRAK